MAGDKWMDRFLVHYVRETEFDPTKESNALTVKTHRSIAEMAALRCGGMDARKIAMFAADVFKYTLLNRQRAIEDVARIAVKDIKDLEAKSETGGD